MTFSNFQLPLLALLSFLGYKGFHKLRFPASRLLGPIIVIAICQMLGLSFAMPTVFKTIFSVIFGVYLGLRFNRASLGKLKSSLVPALLISVLYIGITMLYGELLTTFAGMEQNTAFLSVIPGGVAESVVLAVSYNADLAQVSAFQLFRFLSIVMFVPLAVSFALKSKSRDTLQPSAMGSQSSVGGSQPSAEGSQSSVGDSFSLPLTIKKDLPPVEDEDPLDTLSDEPHLNWRWLFLAGAWGSYLFKLIHFPAALLLGAMFFVSASSLLSKKPFQRPPSLYYDIAQIGMGAVIGISFTKESMVAISGLIGPIAMITLLIMVMSLLLGLLFSKLFKWDFLTGFMSALPGGMSAMLILAEEFDADVVIITSMQMVRLLTAVMVIPMLYKFIL